MAEKIRPPHLPPTSASSQQPLLVPPAPAESSQAVMSLPKLQQVPGLHPQSVPQPDVALHARPATSTVSGTAGAGPGRGRGGACAGRGGDRGGGVARGSVPLEAERAGPGLSGHSRHPVLGGPSPQTQPDEDGPPGGRMREAKSV